MVTLSGDLSRFESEMIIWSLITRRFENYEKIEILKKNNLLLLDSRNWKRNEEEFVCLVAVNCSQKNGIEFTVKLHQYYVLDWKISTWNPSVMLIFPSLCVVKMKKLCTNEFH